PVTEALAVQKLQSLPLTLQWWYESLRAGNLLYLVDNTLGKTWTTETSVALVADALQRYARVRQAKERLPMLNDLVRQLQSACPPITLSRDSTGDGCVLIPTLKECKREWDKYMKHSIKESM
ncbi:MAG: hypothetical protein HQL86_07505, partial [Magnetococcales bacterium]|nr:hypothetical protein [Magnetococcales bacterium]